LQTVGHDAYQKPVLLDASVDVARVQQPLARRNAAQHFLAPTQLGRDDVGRVRVASGQVAEVHVVLCQEVEEPEHDLIGR